MLRSLILIFALLLAMPAAAQAPGAVVKDCPECPELVVVPAGYTRLASGRNVRIAKPFLVGKFEVTFEEYDACVQAGACACCPDDHGWGRGRQPVIDVSWHDAQDYVAWLSKRTGKAYRLLSEAEWEYAAQAGTGREAKVTPGAGKANCYGCGSRWDAQQTAPVGSFPANAFGLHDMLGNVWEWTADCWTDPKRSCGDNPFDRFGPYVLRGGSWYSNPEYTRSALRNWFTPVGRLDGFGFRVARDPVYPQSASDDRLIQYLINADKVGDAAAARILAAEIRRRGIFERKQ
jgi:formylglycine-generating enzyme required for sulfatase activity